jgi:predicted ATPase
MRTNRTEPDHPSAPFLLSVELEEDRVEDWGSYPFHLPFLKGLRVELAPLTFLIGENGSG